jgi:hypothetical protein
VGAAVLAAAVITLLAGRTGGTGPTGRTGGSRTSGRSVHDGSVPES